MCHLNRHRCPELDSEAIQDLDIGMIAICVFETTDLAYSDVLVVQHGLKECQKRNIQLSNYFYLNTAGKFCW